jgi:FMN reductase
MNILILACSLNPESNSQILARQAVADLKSLGATAELVDLRNHPMPFCDGQTSDAATEAIASRIRAADAVIFSVPIYNYDVNAAAKNVLEHAGKSFESKIVAFMCAAGGQGSYMSIMGLANSLMLDFRSVVVPRFVYATYKAFDGDKIVDAEVRQRVAGLCHEVHRFATALAGK